MSHFPWSLNPFHASSIQFLTVALMATGTFPLATSVAQAQDTDYGRCADDLIALDIEVDTAAAACALAFRPTEVSNCVTDVVFISDVSPVSALSACSRDRRPDEVAACVTNIHQWLVIPSSQLVLDRCHRSLLPEQYADCVIGLTAELDYTTEESLSRCIAAGYRPENIAPTFIPTE